MSERVSIKSNALESTQKTATPQPFRTSALRATPSLSDQILLFQCSIGNQAVQRMIKSGNLQAKLKIGQPVIFTSRKQTG